MPEKLLIDDQKNTKKPGKLFLTHKTKYRNSKTFTQQPFTLTTLTQKVFTQKNFTWKVLSEKLLLEKLFTRFASVRVHNLREQNIIHLTSKKEHKQLSSRTRPTNPINYVKY